MEIIRSLEGGVSAHVDLVMDEGQEYALKTDVSPLETVAQKFFIHELQVHNIPSLTVVERPELAPNQLLTDYLTDATKLKDVFDEVTAQQWGNLVARVHAITYDTYFQLDAQGNRQTANWGDFMRDYIADGLRKQRSSDASRGLPGTYLDKIAQVTSSLVSRPVPTFSLTHGDLHVNNVFVQPKNLLLFDNDGTTVIAPPAYDLAIVFGERFGTVLYGDSQAEVQTDKKLLDTFITGYGQLPPKEEIDYYTLARTMHRFPHPVIPDLRQTVASILDRY